MTRLRPGDGRGPARRGRESGQAMVELTVATMFFLGPLFLVIAALGKFADVQATT